MAGLLLAALLAAPPIALPHHAFRLDNGLQVLVHVDARLPLVAVDLSYRVGSADEPPGRTGFAHLFEHLMFMGTARAPRGAFDAWMEAEGAWNNAWTSNDRTYYYEVGPSHSLPLLLWRPVRPTSSSSSPPPPPPPPWRPPQLQTLLRMAAACRRRSARFLRIIAVSWAML